MKHSEYTQSERPQVIPPAPPAGTDEFTLAADPDAVARKAYFTYVNEGCPDGCDVQHWLDAEASLIEDRDRTRTHGFHNRT